MLVENRRRFHAVFENALDPILLLDDRFRFVDGNPAACELLGYGREEILQLTVWDVTPVETRGRVPQFLQRFLAEGTLSGEYTLLCKGGTTREVEFRGVAHILPGLHLAFYQDITERKRAAEALRESAERLQNLTRRLLEVQEEERRHLARELHDEIGQVLATITLHLHTARRQAGAATVPGLDECATLLQQAGEQVRSLALELRPTMLDILGLEATLRWLAERHQQRSGCEVQILGHLSGATPSPELAIACFRVVQEALTNVVRHAAAQHVWIELSHSDSALELIVRDDGRGFDVTPTQEQAVRRGRLGLLGMLERVQLLGGTLVVESEPGHGTRIRASFPLSEASDEPAEFQE
jgi:PAS domain S-box-containing protein